MPDRQRVAAYGVCVDDEDRLLLARAAPSLSLRGRWFLPGGGIQHGENPTQALHREIKEETGLTVVLGPLLTVLSDRVAKWTGTLRPEENGTTDDVRWFTRGELAHLPVARYVEEVIKEFV